AVEISRRVLVVGKGPRVIVHATGRDEERVPEPAVERVERRLDVRARRGRVRDVDERVDPLASERGPHRRVVRAIAHDRPHAGGQPFLPSAAIEHGHVVAGPRERAHQVDADEPPPPQHRRSHRLASPPVRLPAQPMDTATHVVVRVTPSMVPMPSVTSRPMASRLGPSTMAMKSNGPVMPSRWTIVDGPLLTLDSDFFTPLALPAAVSMRT